MAVIGRPNSRYKSPVVCHRGLGVGADHCDDAPMDRMIASYLAAALQASAEALESLAQELPQERRTRVEKQAQLIRGARAGIMAELM